MDSYHILEVSGVSIAREEMVTFDLFEAGAQGVQENLVFEQKQRHYQPDVIETSVKNLIVYFADLPSQEWLQDFVKKYPELSIQSSEHQVVDWLSEWKKSWKAFELCPGYWVVPDWEKENFDSSLGKAIYIEPGMAFGTGTHATTQIASSFLVPFLKQTPIESLVDVGTGSGILCFLADFFSVPLIEAYDNDPESKRVFHENLQKNFSQRIQWKEDWVQAPKSSLDLTVANIIDGVLLDLKPHFQKRNSHYYLFTGILLEREEAFLNEMLEDWDLVVLERKEKDEWVGFLMETRT